MGKSRPDCAISNCLAGNRRCLPSSSALIESTHRPADPPIPAAPPIPFHVDQPDDGPLLASRRPGGSQKCSLISNICQSVIKYCIGRSHFACRCLHLKLQLSPSLPTLRENGGSRAEYWAGSILMAKMVGQEVAI